MKHIIFALLVYCSLQAKSQKITGLDYFGLNGKVLEVNIVAFQAVNINNKWVPDSIGKIDSRKRIQFDTMGNPTSAYIFDTIQSKLRRWIDFKYDNNHIQSFTRYDYSDTMGYELTFFGTQSFFRISKSIRHCKLWSFEKTSENNSEYSTDSSLTIWKGNRYVKEVNLAESEGNFYTLEYDKYGNQIKFLSYENNIMQEGRSIKWIILTMDNYFNWTERIGLSVSDNGEAFHKYEKRQISYYQ